MANRRALLSAGGLMAAGVSLFRPQANPGPALAAPAQAPSTWQQGAIGLKTSQNAQKKTAGLTFVVQDQGWPFLSLQGGVQEFYGSLSTAGGIELGQVVIPGQVSTLGAETADWAHTELSYAAGQLKLTASRLSPAVLVQSSASSLRLLTGSVTGRTFNGGAVSPPTQVQLAPKYFAYSSGGAVRVQALSTTNLTLPALDQGWLLIWFGNNSRLVETRKPLTYSDMAGPEPYATLPQSYAYQADAPLLFVFQTAPATIAQAAGGGVNLAFGASAGNVVMLPLFGREHPEASTTESWSAGLPASIATKASFWAARLSSFPTTVAETYSYDSASDTATIAETITYVAVRAGGTLFAPLPPAVGLAKDLLGIRFSAPLVDSGLPTEFGPLLGIENSASYTWSLSGLRRYTDGRRVVGAGGAAPPDLQRELDTQVDRIVQAGHLAPWIFDDHISNPRGDIYWLNPAETLYHLAEALPVVSEPQRSALASYLRQERAAYPPETVANLRLDQGALRGDYALPPGSSSDPYSSQNVYASGRPELWLKAVPLFSYFGLSRYFELTGDAVPSSVLASANTALDGAMREQDWATQYWFDGFDDRRVAVVNANRHFAGLVGLVKLARLGGDASTEALGRTLLAKAAVLRAGMAHYPRYLASARLLEYPTNAGPDWQTEFSAGRWQGFIFSPNWTDGTDDPRQVAELSQFGAYLYDSSGFRDWERGVVSPYLIAYRDMAPELARLLADHAKPESEIYLNQYTAFIPQWYAAFAEGVLGQEHNISHPVDSYQLFMAKALLQQVSPQELARYADIPWLATGDLFYIHKLAETIRAYRGSSWTS